MVISIHLPPPVMIESAADRAGHPHVVLQLGHVLLGCRLFRERPWQHELGFEHGVAGIHEPVEGSRQIPVHRMLNPALNVGDDAPRVALIPSPVDRFGGDAELDDKIVAEIVRLDFAALFLPQPDQGRLVWAHNHPSVRAADEPAAVYAAPV
jgi:hypothetical protein